ncbi:FadR/GntR family transcriptional regulator [Herbiconiux daphne]|uniref:FCD domain-containing protein n=1 Tax=Herbiconiux daphne TaxID=2970914 RepID=A0ABT2H464_9MICO|nr:FCD domain-containing protein [Herbiconiux daphne]MCS5734704.1 FCD domain-containing protein [Herbiconiux daphne]
MTVASTPATSGILGSGERRAPAARLGVAVVHDLVAAIVTGAVKPGEPLPPEGDLVSSFGVSRTVVRESVKRLEEKGLVTVSQGRGTVVTAPSEWNLLDRVVISTMIENDETLGILDELAQVRGDLESSMAAEAARRRTENDVEHLTAALQVQREALGDLDAFQQLDRRFHDVVMKTSGSRLAESIAHTLVQRASEYARFHGDPGPEGFALTLVEHQRVLDAVAAGDADDAAEAMREHIARSWERRRLPR